MLCFVAGVSCVVSLGLVVVLRIPLGGAGPSRLLGLGAKIWKLIWPIAGLTWRLPTLWILSTYDSYSQ